MAAIVDVVVVGGSVVDDVVETVGPVDVVEEVEDWPAQAAIEETTTAIDSVRR